MHSKFISHDIRGEITVHNLKSSQNTWGLARTTAATGRGSGAPTPGEGYFGEWFAHLPGRARSFRVFHLVDRNIFASERWWEISNNKNTENRRRTCRKTCRMWMSCLKLLRCFKLLRHQAINQSRQPLFLLSSVEFGFHHRTMGQQEP